MKCAGRVTAVARLSSSGASAILPSSRVDGAVCRPTVTRRPMLSRFVCAHYYYTRGSLPLLDHYLFFLQVLWTFLYTWFFSVYISPAFNASNTYTVILINKTVSASISQLWQPFLYIFIKLFEKWKSQNISILIMPDQGV